VVKTIVINPVSDERIESCCTVAAGAIAIGESEALELSNAFKALADPTRVQILSLLGATDEPVCVCEITPLFSISQPTISHHLRILRDAEFIFAERRGTFMYYQLNRARLETLPDATRALFALPVTS